MPLHLLDGPSSRSIQVRWNSSSSGRDTSSHEPEESDIGDAASSQKSGFASAFGFQSLSGLFQGSSTARRSRFSGIARDQQSPGTSASSHDPSNFVGNSDKLAQDASTCTSFNASVLRKVSEDREVPSLSQPETQVGGVSRVTDIAHDSAPPNTPSVIRKQTKSDHGPRRRRLAERRARLSVARSDWLATVQSRHLPNFPARSYVETFSARRSEGQKVPQKPWGLSEEDFAAVDSATETTSGEQHHPGSSEHEPQRLNVSSRTSMKAPASPNLTHVTSSGEAHMVDVGGKPNSSRVAIATAAVVFSNPEPFRLIFENNNKKGDVLGTSRIAGIMAAKRTSDLIPLCHPIAISKAEVDVKLVAPNGHVMWSSNKHGAVAIQSRVETTGPTGVEMEALTAATAAALTVYDMCKAVDRATRIERVVLVYKSGGKSGVFKNDEWARKAGPQFFIDRGLEDGLFNRSGPNRVTRAKSAEMKTDATVASDGASNST